MVLWVGLDMEGGVLQIHLDVPPVQWGGGSAGENVAGEIPLLRKVVW